MFARFSPCFQEVSGRLSGGFREVFARFSRCFRLVENICLINFCVPPGPPPPARGPGGTQKLVRTTLTSAVRLPKIKKQFFCFCVVPCLRYLTFQPDQVFLISLFSLGAAFGSLILRSQLSGTEL